MEKISTAQTNLSRYDNSFYKPGSRFKRLLWFLAGRFFINTYFPYPVALKRLILTAFGARIGSNVMIKPKVNIKYPWYLQIGPHTWIGENVWIDNLTMVNIGANVCLSQGCYILTGNHDFTKTTFDLIIKPVTIEDGAWIGAKATVCPGATVGSHAVLAVNSVATKNMEEYSIYQGNPAVRIKRRHIEL